MAYVEKDSLNYTILCVIEALTITAVDVYILITGYYLSKKETRNLFRVFELIFQVCFFKEVIYFLEIYSGQAVSLRRLFGNLIPNNYFVVLYCALYISSIAINNGIRSLSVAALKKVVMIIMMLFSVWPILVDLLNEVTQKEYIGLSTIGMYGSQSGYTIVTFVCLFVIGAFIRKLGTNLPSPSKCLLSFLALSTIEFIWYICEKRLFQGYYTATFYHNPIIIGAAVSLLCLFLQLDLKSHGARI